MAVDIEVIEQPYDLQVNNLQVERDSEFSLLNTANGALKSAQTQLNGAKDGLRFSQEELTRIKADFDPKFTVKQRQAWQNSLSLQMADVQNREYLVENALIAYNDALLVAQNHQNRIDSINLEIKNILSQKDLAVKDALRSDPEYLKQIGENEAKSIEVKLLAEENAKDRTQRRWIILGASILVLAVSTFIIIKKYRS